MFFNSLRNVPGLGAGATGFLADCFVKQQSTSEKTIRNAVDRGEMITRKNVIKLTSEGMFWANTIGAEMAVEYLYEGRRELVSLEEKTSKIAK